MTSRIFVAGHLGMVGSAVMRLLTGRDDVALLVRSRDQLDLRERAAVREFFAGEAIDQVYLCAARVGGIVANRDHPAEFIYDNLAIACNVVHEAHRAGIDRLLFFASSCCYPKMAAQPIVEAALLTGALEPTNEPYAIAKIAGIKLCESYNRQYGRDYRSIMPTNLYGPGDNYHPVHAHVIPALIRRFHEARLTGAPEVVVWGSGTPRREFLHVDDLAAAAVHVMALDREALEARVSPMSSHVNVGAGMECSIAELATLIAAVTGYVGEIRFDASYPDGTPRKLLDVRVLSDLGWSAGIGLREGLEHAYRWYLDNRATEPPGG